LLRVALKLLATENCELVRFLRGRGVSSVGFETDQGSILIPINSRSIIETFLDGKYFGLETLKAFLNFELSSNRLLNIGANVGTSAKMLVASERYRQIDCFEPDPSNFSYLSLNLADEPTVLIHNTAVGAKPGLLPLNINPQSIGRHSFKTDFGLGSITVPVTTIADLVGGDEKFDIFMDVEGWEIEVLRGASFKLKNCIICALEWNGQLHSRDARLEMIEIVKEAGFLKVADLNDVTRIFEICDIEGLDYQCDLIFSR